MLFSSIQSYLLLILALTVTGYISKVLDNLISNLIDFAETLTSFVTMAKRKGKVVANEPLKLQTLEDSVREVDQKGSDFVVMMRSAKPRS